jgi:predicted GNAT family acetyltransferase
MSHSCQQDEKKKKREQNREEKRLEKTFHHDTEKKRFSLATGNGHTSILDYELIGGGDGEGKKFELYHTEVPDELRGKGVGKAVAEAAFEELFALHPDCHLVLTCTFLQHYHAKNAILYRDKNITNC